MYQFVQGKQTSLALEVTYTRPPSHSEENSGCCMPVAGGLSQCLFLKSDTNACFKMVLLEG